MTVKELIAVLNEGVEKGYGDATVEVFVAKETRVQATDLAYGEIDGLFVIEGSYNYFPNAIGLPKLRHKE